MANWNCLHHCLRDNAVIDPQQQRVFSDAELRSLIATDEQEPRQQQGLLAHAMVISISQQQRVRLHLRTTNDAGGPQVPPLVVLILTLDVVALTFYLKRTRCLYARVWCARFVQGVGMLRDACYVLCLVLACTALLPMWPILLGVGDWHAAALWGSINLLSSFVLYGLWKWTEQLIFRAVMHRV